MSTRDRGRESTVDAGRTTRLAQARGYHPRARTVGDPAAPTVQRTLRVVSNDGRTGQTRVTPGRTNASRNLPPVRRRVSVVRPRVPLPLADTGSRLRQSTLIILVI